jgi:membrane-associated phospholipid phosphatase
MLLAGGSELLPSLLPPASPAAPQAGDVNAFDAVFLVPYSAGLDKAGDACQYAILAVPVLSLFLGDVQDGLGALTVAAEAYSVAYGLKNLLKYAFPRWRPYFYTGGATGVDVDEAAESFPSGHSTLAFTAAAVNTWLFARLLPDSPWFLPFAGLNYALAGATAVLRVASGVHFTTDVIVGALLGTAVGWGVPALRAALLEGKDGGRVSFAASADGVSLRLRFN